MIRTARSLRGGFLGIGAWLSIGALVALGCGGEKKESPAAAPAAAPEATAGQPAAPAAIADAWSSTLPADFPSDVPIYPASTVVKAKDAPESGIMVGWTTTDEPAKVASFFSDSLAAQGWSTQRVDGDDGIVVLADKGSRSITLVLSSAEGKTQIDLLLAQMP